MRLTSLIILLALVGGGIYVVFYTDWLKKGQEAIQAVIGEGIVTLRGRATIPRR